MYFRASVIDPTFNIHNLDRSTINYIMIKITPDMYTVVRCIRWQVSNSAMPNTTKATSQQDVVIVK